MTHPRRIIRDSVVAAIIAADTAAADRVWGAFNPPVNVEKIMIEEGPVVLVYTRGDRSREDAYSTQGAGYVKRTCELCIEILAAGAQAVDNKLDDLSEVIEELIDGFIVPGLPSAEIRLTETNIDATDKFEQPVGGAFLMYDACYWKPWRKTEEDEPDWFPHVVSAVIDGRPPEEVANCDECDKCPDGSLTPGGLT